MPCPIHRHYASPPLSIARSEIEDTSLCQFEMQISWNNIPHAIIFSRVDLDDDNAQLRTSSLDQLQTIPLHVM